MAEQADAPDLGSGSRKGSAGSNPAPRIGEKGKIMKFFLNELKEGKTEFSYDLQKKEAKELFEDTEIRDVVLEAEGWIQRRGLEFILYLSIKGKGNLTCARCLEIFETNFEDNYTYNIFIGKDPAISKKEYNFTDEDTASLYVENFELNILPLIKEIVLLLLPMKPLCKEECKGICPVCGVNKNELDCEHTNGTRNLPLKKLLKKLKK